MYVFAAFIKGAVMHTYMYMCILDGADDEEEVEDPN